MKFSLSSRLALGNRMLTPHNFIICSSVQILAGKDIYGIEINTWTIFCSSNRS